MALIVTAIRVLARIWLGPKAMITYDESCYFTQAEMLGKGLVPYRDFVLAHPPAIPFILAPVTIVASPSTALVISRLVMSVVGGVNAYLVGSIARGFVSRKAALGAMFIYMLLPEVASSERQVLLEPLLNMFCLLAARSWLSADGEPNWKRRAWTTGAFLGFALSCKSWAVLMLLPILVVATPRRRGQELLRVLGGMSGVGLLLISPVLATAPREFFAQAIWYQVSRRGTAVVERAAFNLGLAANGRALLGVVVLGVSFASVIVARKASRLMTFALVWAGTLLAAFLFGPFYIIQHTAHLGPATALAAASSIDVIEHRLLRSNSASTRLRLVSVGLTMVVGASMIVASRGLNLNARQDLLDAPTRVEKALHVCEVGRLG